MQFAGRKSSPVFLMILIGLLSTSTHLSFAQAPDPAIECVRPNVVCVAPGGNWHDIAQAGLNAGKQIYLTDGNLATSDTYFFDAPNVTPLIMNVNGVGVYGEGMYNTTVSRDGSGVTFGILAVGNIIRDLHITDAFEPIKIVGANYDAVEITRSRATNAGAQFIFFDLSEKPDNTGPSIWIRDSIFEGGQRVIHCNTGTGIGIGANTKFVGLDNCTFRDIRDNGNGIVIDNIFDQQRNCCVGIQFYNNNVLVNSDGSMYPWWIYGTTACPVGTVAGSDGLNPRGTVEWDLSNSGTLASAGACCGENPCCNIEGDPRLSVYRRPLPGSAAIGAQFPQGYSGAFPPAGDWNGDGILNDFDQALLEDKKTGAGVLAPMADRVVFDFDGDGDIDNEDHALFLQGYVGHAPGIPTLSGWGAAVLSLLLATAGGALIQRRRMDSGGNREAVLLSRTKSPL